MRKRGRCPIVQVSCSAGQAECPESQTRAPFSSGLKSNALSTRCVSVTPSELCLKYADERRRDTSFVSCLKPLRERDRSPCPQQLFVTGFNEIEKSNSVWCISYDIEGVVPLA